MKEIPTCVKDFDIFGGLIDKELALEKNPLEKGKGGGTMVDTLAILSWCWVGHISLL